MANSVRYFQLTPNILMEYTYSGLEKETNQKGESRYVLDLYEDSVHTAFVVDSPYDKSRNLLLKSLKLPEGGGRDNRYFDNFVIPSNISESKFIRYKNGNDTINTLPQVPVKEESLSSLETDNTSDVLFDKFRIHFTSRDCIGSYDGLILRVIVNDNNDRKVSLMSICIKKTDIVDSAIINENPILINQRLYTTYIDFAIPSINAIIKCTSVYDSSGSYNLYGEQKLKEGLFNTDDELRIPSMVFSVYGIRSTADVQNFEYYTVEKINSAYIPVYDKFDKLNIVVRESTNGDYFDIHPEVGNGIMSFSDYVYNISNGKPDLYIILYDLKLTEYTNGNDGNTEEVIPKITRREQYIVNTINADGSLNELELDEPIHYRPIIFNNNVSKFNIDVQVKLCNTVDNTTTVVRGSCDYGGVNEKGKTEVVAKYGKSLNTINFTGTPKTINVYNLKPDIDTDSVKITNSGTNVSIENHQHSIIGFVESINVGVSIEQIPKEVL